MSTEKKSSYTGLYVLGAVVALLYGCAHMLNAPSTPSPPLSKAERDQWRHDAIIDLGRYLGEKGVGNVRDAYTLADYMQRSVNKGGTDTNNGDAAFNLFISTKPLKTDEYMQAMKLWDQIKYATEPDAKPAPVLPVDDGVPACNATDCTTGRAPTAIELESLRLSFSSLKTTAPVPIRRFDTDADRQGYEHWLNEMSTRMTPRLPERNNRLALLQSLDYEATRAGLDRQLVLAVIDVASDFQKYSIADNGARGLTQVMPFWTSLIGDGDVRRLFEVQTNLRYGCVILRYDVDHSFGDLFKALTAYHQQMQMRGTEPGVVAVTQEDIGFANRVLAAWKTNWQQ